MKAWLVTWDWAGDEAAVVDVIAAVINSRKSASYVADFVEFLYYQRSTRFYEFMDYAKSRRHIPYRAEIDFNSRVSCGHNPWLWAERVYDLNVQMDPDTNLEIISWHTCPTWAAKGTKLLRVSDGEQRKVHRTIAGPLSNASMWNLIPE
jgi:hypothetical protein